MKLNIQCPINQTSYGYVSSYLLSHLNKLGCDIRHIPIGRNSYDPYLENDVKSVTDKIGYFRDSPTLKIWHQHDLKCAVGSPEVGFPIFELESFNEVESKSIKNADFILVCSEWAKDRVKALKREDVYVVPLGYDNTIFRHSPITQGKTVFGNFGKWEIRKGHDVLYKAFNDAFGKNDDVELVMLPSNSFLKASQTREWVSRYKESKLGDKITIYPRLKTQSMVADLMSRVDCGVFPARAEGWNLEALELLACGKHLIITNCTGHTEFCNKENSRLIEMTSGFEKAEDGVFFNGLSEWRSFKNNEYDQLVHYLREVHKIKSGGGLSDNFFGLDTSVNYTWNQVSVQLKETLGKIL
jgi:glycosyltransferase involved in cell wall biosynthesis